ncbi:MAG: DNA polymerase III subunit gamma/tau [Clostridia bacterium]|nr:DNA polymerase III subunit gamma/tau [Clostridia bacterium]
MDHQALYRKFRPETFSDLYGQEAIVTALKNQLIHNKCAHAYLFCGTRGTGKTTTARLLARAVNCENLTDGEPCNACEACRSMKENTAIDVVEIDAASNTSVDNVRQIREEITYPPMSLRKKVYIIDEVHMLSGGAFNALLKTLEEPPEYAMFILATTEYHKVPQTILSRCQRFDFKRISGKTIGDRLEYVLKESGAEYEQDAISAVAYAADGSMRDGLSILEKCLSFSTEKLTAQAVAKVLGTVDDTDLFKMSSAIATKDAATVISVCESTITEGRDPLLLTVYLMEHFRCLMVASLVQDPKEILQMNEERASAFSAESKKFALPQIITILKSLTNIYKSQKETPNPKMLLEIGLAAICAHGQKVPQSQMPVMPNPQPPMFTPIMRVEEKPKQVSDFPPVPVEENPTPAEPDIPIPVSEPEPLTEPAPYEEPPARPVMDENHGTLQEAIQNWNRVADQLLYAKKGAISAHLGLCRPVAENDNTLLLIFRPENKINHDMMERKNNKEALQDAIWEVVGLRPNIHCCYTNENAALAQQVTPAQGISDLEKEFGDFIKFED